MKYSVYGLTPENEDYVVAYCGENLEHAKEHAQTEQKRHMDYAVWILASDRGVRDVLDINGNKISELDNFDPKSLRNKGE